MSQPSEKITHIMLNGKNYLPWVRTITIGHRGRGKIEHITGESTLSKPVLPNAPTAQEEKTIKEWKIKDLLVNGWLMNCMEPTVADLCMYENTAHEVWKRLEKHYGQKNNYSRIYQFQREIQQTKQQPNQSITELLSHIQKKKDELKNYRPPTTDLEELQRREEQDNILLFLASLDPSYETVRSQILLSGELPSFDSVASMIQNEESRREVMSSQPTDNPEAKAFAVAKPNPNPRSKHRGDQAIR